MGSEPSRPKSMQSLEVDLRWFVGLYLSRIGLIGLVQIHALILKPIHERQRAQSAVYWVSYWDSIHPIYTNELECLSKEGV